ncbi:phage tail protein [Actinomadura nitritigenes]|uniref:phage tail protein n=1 Tax=Actinomadura nitritigenes TaxID=134602 RepID=UPI0036943CBC
MSGYSRYLPPVLAGAPLGDLLRIFEKTLGGLPDGVPAHDALAAEIAALDRLVDPWTTPERFLPWLASWVALEFPTLQGADLWDEYQRRRVISRIASVYRGRGRQSALNAYLDLYAVGAIRPRITLDVGRRLLAVAPSGAVSGLVTLGPLPGGSGGAGGSPLGLIRPECVAVAADGSLFVGDRGLPSGVPVTAPARVWRLDPSGRHDMGGTPPRPLPLVPDTPFTRVAAVAVRPARGARPETLYVLDEPGRLYAVPAPFQDRAATLVTSLATAGTTFRPRAMAVDPASGDLLVLDAGDGPDAPNPPKILTVRPDPPAVTRNALPSAREPLSLMVDRDGTVLVGDGGPQEPTGPEQYPGALLRVVRSGASWSVTPLPVGPLVAPTGLARGRDGRLYVVDVGLKPLLPSDVTPFICPVAEDAGVFLITGDRAVRVTPPAQFVYPAGLAAAGDRLVVCDPGQPPGGGLAPYWSRVRPFRFNVVLHFAADRVPADEDARRRALGNIVDNVSAIVDEERPAHTLWDLITSI